MPPNKPKLRTREAMLKHLDENVGEAITDDMLPLCNLIALEFVLTDTEYGKQQPTFFYMDTKRKKRVYHISKCVIYRTDFGIAKDHKIMCCVDKVERIPGQKRWIIYV